MKRRTVVVQGGLAYATRRAAAAREGEIGLQIVTLPQLAARLAGGFYRLATSGEIDIAVRTALEMGDFEDLADSWDLPGMTRATARTLGNAWSSGLRLGLDSEHRRVRDLARIEQRVRSLLPEGAMLPDALIQAAVSRAQLAPVVLGQVMLEAIHFVEPVWRPLIDAVRATVATTWLAPNGAETDWFRDSIIPREGGPVGPPLVVTCADSRHEVLEAFRWARELLAAGKAKANEIAIAATTTDEWDDHVLALADETGLRVSFLQGRPCLATFDGQCCAALADVLLRGLSQTRVRRLVALLNGHRTVLDTLPDGWLLIPGTASISSASDWQRALKKSQPGVAEGHYSRSIDLLEQLEQGPEAAAEAGELLLRGRAKQLWARALSIAPPAAIELSLRSLRVQDDQDPGDAIAWVPAWQLAASPRPWARLLGMTGRSWPRPSGEDPLLPDHIVAAQDLEADPPAQADRRAFSIIGRFATGQLVLSRSRRNAQGARIGASPLLTRDLIVEDLTREAPALHASSESDRLSSRPMEVLATPALQCWQDWHRSELTIHDGQVSASDPVVFARLAEAQSATSLVRLVRDPMGFLWKYALGWYEPEHREFPLRLADNEFGSLVHELLRRTVDALEPAPGFTVASRDEIAAALQEAADRIREEWPTERAVPPDVLWANTVRQAHEMALTGLTWESFTEGGTRSWTEVPFGEPADTQSPIELPWDSKATVTIPETSVKIRGKVDRLDLRADGSAARVTDYKTGERPKNAASVIIAGGAELQRVIYALACRQLLEGPPKVVPRLVYLRGGVLKAGLADLDGAIDQVGRLVNAATAHILGTTVVLGPGAASVDNDMRLALPSSPGYFRRKQAGFDAASTELRRLWKLK